MVQLLEQILFLRSSAEADLPSTAEADLPSTTEADLPSTAEADLPSTSEAILSSTFEAEEALNYKEAVNSAAANVLASTFEVILSSTFEAEEALDLEGAVNSTNEAQHHFIDNLFNAMFPGEERVACEEVVIGHVDRVEGRNITDVATDVDEIPECQNFFKPKDTSSVKQKSPKRKSEDDGDLVNKRKRKASTAVTSTSTTFRRSNRIREKQTTLDRLLQVPTKSVQNKELEKERHFSKMVNKINDEKREHEKEMAALNEWSAENRRKEEIYRKETEDLILLAHILRKELTEEKLKEIFFHNLQYFKDVKSGVEKNWRHKLYKSPGNSDPTLRAHMVGPPFSDAQQDLVYEQAKEIWLTDMDMYRENNFYISHVLLPTIFIRIYQVFMEVDSFEEAERRINNAKASIAGLEEDSSI